MKNNVRGRNSQSSDSSWGPFLFGALAGGAIGAALALWYAPAEGTEFRKDVGEKFDEITESINGILKNAKMSAEKMLNEGRGQAEDILDSAYSGARDFVEDAEDAMGLKVRKANPNEAGSQETGGGSSMNSASSTGMGNGQKPDGNGQTDTNSGAV